uniref:hypothetical protein n=1 Tax=Algoriphagus sp. TaxID=1872435 RepID=UPI004048CBEF
LISPIHPIKSNPLNPVINFRIGSTRCCGLDDSSGSFFPGYTYLRQVGIPGAMQGLILHGGSLLDTILVEIGCS